MERRRRKRGLVYLKADESDRPFPTLCGCVRPHLPERCLTHVFSLCPLPGCFALLRVPFVVSGVLYAFARLSSVSLVDTRRLKGVRIACLFVACEPRCLGCLIYLTGSSVTTPTSSHWEKAWLVCTRPSVPGFKAVLELHRMRACLGMLPLPTTQQSTLPPLWTFLIRVSKIFAKTDLVMRSQSEPSPYKWANPFSWNRQVCAWSMCLQWAVSMNPR